MYFLMQNYLCTGKFTESKQMTDYLNNCLKPERFIRPNGINDEEAIRWLNWDIICVKEFLTRFGGGKDDEKLPVANVLSLNDLAAEKYMGDFPNFAESMASAFEHEIMPYASKKLKGSVSHRHSKVGGILGIDGKYLSAKLAISIWAEYKFIRLKLKDDQRACDKLKIRYHSKSYIAILILIIINLTSAKRTLCIYVLIFA